MAINYCGHRLARSLGWAAPAYPEKEAAIPHLGVRKNCLQYDGRSDGRFGVQVGMWNLCCLSGKGVCEKLRKRMIDVCFLQVRSRGQGAKMLGMRRRRCKLW